MQHRDTLLFQSKEKGDSFLSPSPPHPLGKVHSPGTPDTWIYSPHVTPANEATPSAIEPHMQFQSSAPIHTMQLSEQQLQQQNLQQQQQPQRSKGLTPAAQGQPSHRDHLRPSSAPRSITITAPKQMRINGNRPDSPDYPKRVLGTRTSPVDELTSATPSQQIRSVKGSLGEWVIEGCLQLLWYGICYDFS
jgi:hypothetical protein